MLKGAERLLDNDLEGMREQVALQTLYEFVMSHMAATRSECFRSDKMALCFTREIHAIGPEGTTVFCWYNNGGKESKHWHLSLFILHVPITHYILNHQLPCVIIIVIVTCALFILQEEKQQR